MIEVCCDLLGQIENNHDFLKIYKMENIKLCLKPYPGGGLQDSGCIRLCE